MEKTIIELEQIRMAWSLKTFTEATAISSLRKLEEEIKEVECATVDILNITEREHLIEEYADCQMCLFDSAGRNHNITPQEIFMAFAKKLQINMACEWVKQPDNTYKRIKNLTPPTV